MGPGCCAQAVGPFARPAASLRLVDTCGTGVRGGPAFNHLPPRGPCGPPRCGAASPSTASQTAKRKVGSADVAEAPRFSTSQSSAPVRDPGLAPQWGYLPFRRQAGIRPWWGLAPLAPALGGAHGGSIAGASCQSACARGPGDRLWPRLEPLEPMPDACSARRRAEPCGPWRWRPRRGLPRGTKQLRFGGQEAVQAWSIDPSGDGSAAGSVGGLRRRPGPGHEPADPLRDVLAGGGSLAQREVRWH